MVDFARPPAKQRAMGSPEPLPPPPALAEIAREAPVALFLDFDGTLVDIADRPELIDVPGHLARNLLRLADALAGRLAVVSGRSIADLQRYLGDVPLAFGGSHGLEARLADGTSAAHSTAGIDANLVSELESFVARHDGLQLETKSLGAAVHYRAVPQLQDAVLERLTALSRQHALAIKQGKCVVELLPPGASKAAAVGALMEREPFGTGMPVFIGDDVTDEDGFLEATARGGFGIAVGERVSKNARYRLASPDAVREWCKL